MTAALEHLACDVCAGRTTIDDVQVDTVTCSQHFIDAVFPEEEERRKPRVQNNCPDCGWPFKRVQVSCPSAYAHGREDA